MSRSAVLEPPAPPSDLPEDPGPRVSRRRVLSLVLVVALLAVLAVGVQREVVPRVAEATAAAKDASVFAPYVDVTLPPATAFQDVAANPARHTVLGFVVAGTGADVCTPTWGTYATLPEASSAFDLDRRLTQYRGEGGTAIVSFGGAANSELAVACPTASQVEAAYRAVVDRYHVTTLDFDIEGAAMADLAATARRAEAVHALQQAELASGRRLEVWLTLPVTPQGLDDAGIAVVRDTLAGGVDLAGVNVMAMDFAGVRPQQTVESITSAVTATQAQVDVLFTQAGRAPTLSQRWGRVGVTVMIGQDDLEGNLTVAGAEEVAAFAAEHHLGRVSMWSLNRDVQCGSTFAVVGTHSNHCSGAAQKALDYSKAFDETLPAKGRAAPADGEDLGQLATAAPDDPDDPARSPYPIWQATYPYSRGYKVVWHRAVYVARWYTRGEQPDLTGQTSAPSAWQLVGPVLATDRAPELPRVAAGTAPEWTPQAVYRAGDEVLRDGLLYEAKYYSTGNDPADAQSDPTASPWKPLYTVPGEPTATD